MAAGLTLSQRLSEESELVDVDIFCSTVDLCFKAAPGVK